jgi:hypothetical protein
MKKFIEIEPEEMIRNEENNRKQHRFNPFTSIIGILVVLAFAIVIARVFIALIQIILY